MFIFCLQANRGPILDFARYFGQNSIFIAGSKAKSLCDELSQSFQAPIGISIQQTFTQYFRQGSNASIEFSTKPYPNGTILEGTNVEKIVQVVGPDLNVSSQAGYGRFKEHDWQDSGCQHFVDLWPKCKPVQLHPF